jgi:hypothetical protein
MFPLFKRGGTAGSQIGVLVTPEGVAAAQLSPKAGGKPHLDRCVYERRGSEDPFTRVISRLPNRRAPTVNYFESHYEQTSIQHLHTCGLDGADREQLASELAVAVHDVVQLEGREKALTTQLARIDPGPDHSRNTFCQLEFFEDLCGS